MDYNITYRQKDKGIQFIISYKDNNGKWKQKSKQGFKTKKDAKKVAEDFLDKLKEDISLNVPQEFDGVTFREFGIEYLNHTKVYRSYKTIQSTQTVLNKFSNLNEIELSKITTLDIQKTVDSLTKEGLNPNTIKYYLKKLTIIFNAAKNQYNIINTIPTKNIKITKSKEVIKKALTTKEVDQLLTSLHNSEYYLLVFIAVNTGMRIGEILGLTWKDINIKDNIINVNKQWKRLNTGDFGFGELKSKNSKRLVPISKAVKEEILNYKTILYIDSRIFSFKNKDSVIKMVNELLKSKGFDISFHELRHTYATKLVANGLDFKTVAKILGHDIQQTMKTYSHVNSDMLDRAKQLIEIIF